MDDIFSGMLCFPENICSSNSQVLPHVSLLILLHCNTKSILSSCSMKKNMLFFPLNAFCIFETFQNFGRCFDITQHHIIISTTWQLLMTATNI